MVDGTCATTRARIFWTRCSLSMFACVWMPLLTSSELNETSAVCVFTDSFQHLQNPASQSPGVTEPNLCRGFTVSIGVAISFNCLFRSDIRVCAIAQLTCLFWADLATNGIYHFHSWHWHRENDRNIATTMGALTPTMIHLHLRQIWFDSVQ